jgi:hypothetical protein
MKKSLVLLSSLLAAFAVSTACSVERSSSVLGPSATSATASASSSNSLIGTWVVQGATVKTATTSSSLPDFSQCSNLSWAVDSQTAAQASGHFSADCGGGLTLTGTITAQLGGATIPLAIQGQLIQGSNNCAFSLTGTGTQVDASTIHITYSGSTCLGPLSGANNLSLAPHSAPTSFNVTGTVTDGTSGGVLPNVEARIGDMAVRTDASGQYLLPGVPTGPVTVQFAAASYVTQTKTATVSAATTIDVVLQRFAPPPPPPVAAPSGGADQIDMHSVIVRGPGGDVANWPVTTQIHVIDANSGGFFVDFDAKNRWPEVTPPGWDGGIQYTLWCVMNINGQWVTAGGVEFWKSLARQGGPPSRLSSNWYYSPGVWGELASHQPAVGEMVGFFVTAGDQRAKDVRVVTERSNVVLVPFPSDGGGYYPF